VTWEEETQKVRLVSHRVFQPTADQPLDFEATIERTLLDWHKAYFLRKIFFDPYQMQATAQRLTKAGLRIIEFAQTPANLTAASQNLFDLIQGQRLILYPDAGMRLAISRTVALETPRGWRVAKEKQSHKIDVVVALAMATYAASSTMQKVTTIRTTTLGSATAAGSHSELACYNERRKNYHIVRASTAAIPIIDR
jgi:phage terminase large subunit-like protein